MMSVIALVTDLIFATKIGGTARSLGVPLSIVRSLEALTAGAAGHQLALIDLNAEGVDTVAAVRACKAAEPAPFVIAYLSHVQTDLAAAAREAGADLVLPRSRFSAELPELLKDRASESAPNPKW